MPCKLLNNNALLVVVHLIGFGVQFFFRGFWLKKRMGVFVFSGGQVISTRDSEHTPFLKFLKAMAPA